MTPRIPAETERAAALRSICVEDGVLWPNFVYYNDNVLLPFDVRGRRILDIGGADGTRALYLRLCKQAHADLLDQYEGHGSPASNYDRLLRRLEILNVEEIGIMRGDARTVELPRNTYDHIVVRNCLHHVFARFSPDPPVVEFMERARDCLRPGGTMVIGEISWLALWRWIPGLNTYMQKTAQGIRGKYGVNYKNKSHYSRWLRCAEGAGLRFKRLEWYVPFRLRRLRPLLANQLANSCLFASYVLEVERPRDDDC